MKVIPLCLSILLVALGLCSCDSIKQRVTGFLDDAIGDSPGETSSYKGQTIRQITAEDYKEFTSIKGHVVIVDFYADWCPPCRKLSPVLNELVAKHQGRVLLGKVDTEKEKQLAGKMKVRNIPDVRLFVDGKQVDRFVGMPPVSAVRHRVERQLKKLKPVPEKQEESQELPAVTPFTPAAAKPKPADGQGQPAEADDSSGGQPTVQPMDKDWLPPGLERN